MLSTLSVYSLCMVMMSLWLPGMPQRSELCAPVSLVPLIATPAWMEWSKASVERVRRYARSITVTVWVEDRWSSGILVHRQGQTYTVITNQHVVDFGENYQVMMSDGKRYKAHLRQSAEDEEDDLAALEFQSTEASYPVAMFAPSLSLVPGAPVFAAGFPIADLSNQQPQFHFTLGEVSWVSNRVLKGGYQIGYTNLIKKGMSGGPVLNRWGQVIAMNGMHAYPLWGDPYIFVDGSKPNPEEYKVMQRSSWAIPAERFLKFVPTADKIRL